METEYEDSIEIALTLMELRSVFLITSVSGLLHLFERQLLKHLNHELRDWFVEEITDWGDARSVLEKLKFKSVHQQLFDRTEIQHVLDDPDLRKLQLVTNSVKHDPGCSYDQLQAMKAVVVNEIRLEDDRIVDPWPTLGISVAILSGDVEWYQDCLLHFWKMEGTFAAPLSAFDK